MHFFVGALYGCEFVSGITISLRLSLLFFETLLILIQIFFKRLMIDMRMVLCCMWVCGRGIGNLNMMKF